MDYVGYAYLLPAFLFFVPFVALPLLHAIAISFFQWDGLSDPSWVGFDNYVSVWEDEGLRGAFLHSLYLIVFFSFIPIMLGLFLTAVMSRRPVPGTTAFRTILFLPQVIPLVVVGLVWRWIYAPDGILNSTLEAVGLEFVTRPWLGDFTFALVAVGLVGSWVLYGLAMVMFMAGVQKIPLELYEAAQVDGAGPFREFFAVTLPGLRREVVVVATITVLIAFKAFDLVYVMTGGGPGTATTVPAVQIVREAFQIGRVGVASALGIVLSVVVVAAVLLVVRIGESDE